MYTGRIGCLLGTSESKEASTEQPARELNKTRAQLSQKVTDAPEFVSKKQFDGWAIPFNFMINDIVYSSQAELLTAMQVCLIDGSYARKHYRILIEKSDTESFQKMIRLWLDVGPKFQEAKFYLSDNYLKKPFAIGYPQMKSLGISLKLNVG